MPYLLLLSLLFALTAADRAYSQDCPVISVSCPDSVTDPTLVFNANVTGDPSAKLKFKWTLSSGKITSGQGTASITVDTTETGGQSITGTVEVDGIPKECGNKASCSIIVCPLPVARKFDEYGDLKWTGEPVRLKPLHSRRSTRRRAMHRSRKRRLLKQTI
jgi:hypothetical protein